MSASFEKINLKEDEGADGSEDEDVLHATKSVCSLKSTSAHKMDKIALLRPEEAEKKKKIDNDEMLGGYYKGVVSSVNRCNITIDSHKATLEQTKEETVDLMKKLQETDKITNQLKNTNFVADKADEMVHEILKEEYMFQRQTKRSTADEFLEKLTDKNGNEARKESKVTLEEKRKLLEALRAIDNGDSVDVAVTDATNRKSKLMKELFGNSN